MNNPRSVTAAILDGVALPDAWEIAAADDNDALTRLRQHLVRQRVGREVMASIPHRVLTRAACDAICTRIRRDRVIPVWVPREVQEQFEPFHKWKKVCWYIPWVVLGNVMSGPMCVELQGISIADSEATFQLAVSADHIEDVPALAASSFHPMVLPFFEEEPRWRRWVFTYREGAGQLSLFEFQPDERAGFHLEIAHAILEVQWPVIDRNRDTSIIVHDPNDPEWRVFDQLEDVVAWGFDGAMG